MGVSAVGLQVREPAVCVCAVGSQVWEPAVCVIAIYRLASPGTCWLAGKRPFSWLSTLAR